MKPISLLAGVAALLLTPAIAAAQAHFVLGVPDDGMRIMDRNAVQWKQSNPTVPIITVHRTPVAFERDYGGYDWVQTSHLTYEFDCPAARLRTIRFVERSFSGVALSTLTDPSEWQAVNLDSIAGSAFRITCRNDVPSTVDPSDADQAGLIAAYYNVMNGDDD